MHNIPIGYRNKSVAEDICEAIGQVDRSTSISASEGGSYVRVRVTLDIYQPLCQGRVVTFEEGGKTWVSFRYERLPNFCYWCGCFDHGDRDCDSWIQSKGTLRAEDQQFGSWVRASQTGPPKKTVVRVSGFYEDRVENVSTRRRREMKSSPMATGPILKSNTTVHMDKETIDVGTDFVGTNNTNPHNHGPVTETPTPVVQVHGNQGNYFEEQLNEIDTELGIYEQPRNSGYTENAAPIHVTTQPFNMENLKNELASNQGFVETPPSDMPRHRAHARPLQDVTNYSHAPLSVKKPSQTKWKRLVREFSGTASTTEDPIGSKRPIDMAIDLSESPRKKILVSYGDTENYLIMAEADFQPRQAQ